MNHNVIGGDPGTQGGVAVLGPLGRVLFVAAFRPDMTLNEFRNICQEAAAVAGPGARGWVEQVGTRPGEGPVGAFTFGRGYGWLEMGLASHDVDVRHVSPLMWQARLECLTGGNKAVSLRRAMDMFGAQVGELVTKATADALLIAEYGRHMAGRP